MKTEFHEPEDLIIEAATIHMNLLEIVSGYPLEVAERRDLIRRVELDQELRALNDWRWENADEGQEPDTRRVF